MSMTERLAAANTERRYAVLQVKVEMLLHGLLKMDGGSLVKVRGVPDNAELVYASMDANGILNIVLRSSLFDPVLEGCLPPVLSAPTISELLLTDEELVETQRRWRALLGEAS